MENFTFGFLGLGLIGGSIAKAIKEHINNATIIVYDTNKETLSLAYKENTIDTIVTEIDSTFSLCDYLFLCAPIDYNNQNLIQVSKFLSKDCIITDVGSVKKEIHKTVQSLFLTSQFIGGHPMAGSERTGYRNSKSLLLENAYYILTPTNDVPLKKIEQYQNLVKKIGAIPVILDFSTHDYATAAISHLPHIISACLVNLVNEKDTKDEIMKMIAAGGFKDITRISSSSPSMWEKISFSNKKNIILLLDSYIESLRNVKENLLNENKKYIYDMFHNASLYRDTFIDAPRGPLKTSYTITIDIPDKAGMLAFVANLLAEHDINIKNIGIVHNREYEEGILRIEFYEEKSIEISKKLLKEKGLSVH